MFFGGVESQLPTSINPDYTTVDITEHAKQVVKIVELAASVDEKLTPLKLVDTWMGKGPAKRRKMIQTTTLCRLQAEAMVVTMLLQGYLRYLRLVILSCFFFFFSKAKTIAVFNLNIIQYCSYGKCLSIPPRERLLSYVLPNRHRSEQHEGNVEALFWR